MLTYFSPLNMIDCNIINHVIVNKMSITYENIIHKGAIEQNLSCGTSLVSFKLI